MSPARQAGRSSRRPSAESSGTRRSSESRSPLIRLQQEIASCTACASLKPWRQFTPTAYGTVATGYLMVGEAPGYRSWANGRRFTGPAGMLIRRALHAVGHPRYVDLEDLFYITDVVKCHPASSGNTPSNRSPKRSEIETCRHHLVRELEVLQPRVIVTFGKVAAEAIFRALPHAHGAGMRGEPIGPELLSFPHPSPRNQLAIRKQYPSMEAYADALTGVFRELISRLGGDPAHA